MDKKDIDKLRSGDWLSTRESAQFLGVPTPFFYHLRLMETPNFPEPQKVVGRCFFNKAELIAWRENYLATRPRASRIRKAYEQQQADAAQRATAGSQGRAA